MAPLALLIFQRISSSDGARGAAEGGYFFNCPHSLNPLKACLRFAHPYLTKRLISLMLEYKMPEAKDFIPAAESLAEKFEAELNFNAAHDAWLLVGRLQHFSGNSEGGTASVIKAAETHQEWFYQKP